MFVMNIRLLLTHFSLNEISELPGVCGYCAKLYRIPLSRLAVWLAEWDAMQDLETTGVN